ncbi:hypothetical protein B0J14DRAFT_121088 [Halenospora varia]|nr:hypothetical protein B0J14DRAFT_121088 [Halenospora varia]
MASTGGNGRPTVARRNTFQRMLDLEKKNKVNRMQASSNTSLVSLARTNTTFERDANSHQNRPPAVLQTHGRAMTAPTLSLAIPYNELKKNGPTKKFVIKQGNVVPQEEADEGAESDRSSICHSPGWDDITGKKKKKEKKEAKEKRKMEKIKEKTKTEAPPVANSEIKPEMKMETEAEKKKKLETEAMHNMKKKKRLSKPPPTNPRLSKIAMQMDRAASSPEIPTVADSPEVKVDVKKSPVKAPRSRRGSLDISFKHLFSSSQSIPALWKHEKTTPPPTKDAPSPSSGRGSSGGFIGGLKLRLSEEAAAQDKTRHSISVMKYEDQKGLLDTDQDSTPTTSIRTSVRDTSIEPKLRAQPVTTTSSIYEEAVRTPQQWDAIYTQAGRMAVGGSSATLDDDVPIMQRGKPRNGRVSISSLEPEVSPPLVSEYSGRDSFAAGKSRSSMPARPRTSEDLGSYGPRRSSPPSISRISQQSRDRSGSRNGREIHNSYVQDQRKQSQDRAIEAFQEECRITNSPDSTSRGRSLSFHSVKSRVSLSADGASVSRVADPDAPALPESDKAFSFFSDYTPPELHFDSTPTSPMPTLTHERKESKGLKGFRNAAKAALSRSSTDVPIANVSKTASQNDSRPSSQRTATIGLAEGVTGKPSKVERLLGEDASSVKDSSRPTSSGRRLANPPTSSSKLFEHLNGSSPPGHKRGSNSHARTATDSSEEYSTLDEFSNVTTPMASRPQSQKDYFSPIADLETVMQAGAAGSTNSLPQRAKKSAVISGKLPYDEAMNRSQDSWSRTAIPMDLTDTEERLRTPKGDQSNSNLSTTLTGTFSNESKSDESSKETATAGVQRQPSLSRSISTPEMQDLSFLPALKHQALTRPAGKKGRGLVLRKKSGVRVSTNKDLVRPPAIPIPSPSAKSEGSSPDSPTGGAYLRDARLHIPKPPPRSPNRARFSGDTRVRNSSPQGGVEPIAKMFVVCCSCKYFHDMPSKIYECMAKPDNVVEDKNLGVSGVISTSVKCPWCGHGMSTACCAGYAAVVYMKEKLH